MSQPLLDSLSLSSPSSSPRRRDKINDSHFRTIHFLFEAIQNKKISIESDMKVEIERSVGVVGIRDGSPFVLEYSKDHILGKGGYGVVYKGKLYRDLTNETKFSQIAVKLPIDEESIEEFEWEIQIHEKLAKLTIPQIQKLELVTGMLLVSSYRIATSRSIIPRPFNVKREMFLKVAATLNVLMGLGFYYTDAKPDNFLLDGDCLEVVDLSAISELSHIPESQWKKSLFAKVYDPKDKDILLSIDPKYHHITLWKALVNAPKKTYQDYNQFRQMVEKLMAFALLMTFYELTTGELPSDRPTVFVHPKENPIKKEALELLTTSGCPSLKTAEFLSYLNLEKPLTMEGLLSFLNV